MSRSARTWITAAGFCAALGVMGTITAYSVTLYRLFCAATGANGTTQRVAGNDAVRVAREVTVFFNTDVAPGLPWRFAPMQPSVKLHLGEDTLVFFEARNQSDHAIVGHATFNVTPEKAGLYFKKIQCFCFSEERLAAGETAQMPVDFFVDPALATDPGTADVHEITLSYTFFESKSPRGAADLSRFAAADPAAGGRLFAERCSACHALDRARIGPPLGGVVGRTAGSVPGYPYSAALRAAGFTWDAIRLDRWLADPQAMVAGTEMQIRVPEAASRRDLIAYLKAGRTGS